MKKTILKWRLKELPSPESLDKLVASGILSKDEARQILFSEDEIKTEEDRDKDSLKSEIKFLRELVEKLSSSQTRTIEVIRTIEKPYWQWGWYKPYEVWCDSPSFTTTTSTPDTGNAYANTGFSFSGIKTF